MKNFRKLSLALTILLMTWSPAISAEKPIGLPQTQSGMEIAAVYLQPIEMESSSDKQAMTARKDTDIHLEADIHASENNPNGFAGGEWIPYLSIHYTLINLDNKKKIEGMMMPMVASDGPHYGDNVKMAGIGKYKLILKIDNPMKQGFGRHTDKETGVGLWFKPFELEYKFNYLGSGKKGGY